MFNEVNSVSFFIDLLALSLVLAPLLYFVKNAAVREGALTIAGAYLLYFIAPRLAVFYLVFWLCVYVLQQITARLSEHKLSAAVFWLCLSFMLAPMVIWKIIDDDFTAFFNVWSNEGVRLFSDTLWKIDLARAVFVPLGLSFATFRGADLLIKSWLGQLPALPLRKIFFYGFFPPVQAIGPIIEYKETDTYQKPTAQDIYNGLMRISFGFIKVLLMAGIIKSSAGVFHGHETMSAPMVWLYLIIFTWFFYLNFSGFSDLAIGTARLYGYRLKENFCFPYFRRNIAEFWNNWHMSLSRFAQRNAYIPLGGYRAKTQYIALFGTIFVIALWHDISWGMVAFALYHGCGLAAQRYWSIKHSKKEDRALTVWAYTGATYLFVLLSFPLLMMPLSKVGAFYLSMVGF